MPFDLFAISAGATRAVARTAAFAIVLGFAALPCKSQSTSDSLSAVPRAQVAALGYYAHAHPYLEEPAARLLKHIPELDGLRPARAQELLPVILMHTGMRVRELFANMVDLASHEEVTQKIQTPRGGILAQQNAQYNYLILLNREVNPPQYEEYRADAVGTRLEQDGVQLGFAITAGFALKCIYFLPAQQEDSAFRYLGDEVMGGRDTYVVAFAQRPEQTTFWGTVTTALGTVRILDQGIAWIDKSTFQILRLRTDLLAAHPEIGLARQTTEISFGEVQIPEVAARLWLPSEASVDADYQGRTFRNEHRYSDYQRFRVSVRMGTVGSR